MTGDNVSANRVVGNMAFQGLIHRQLAIVASLFLLVFRETSTTYQSLPCSTTVRQIPLLAIKSPNLTSAKNPNSQIELLSVHHPVLA